MNLLVPGAFNLFFNATGSFLAGLAIVALVVRLFRVNDSRWKLALYFLPYFKILWDISYRQIPASSILRTGIDPFLLPPKSQTLELGGNLSHLGPSLNLVFQADLPNGTSVSTSIADYFYFYVRDQLGAWAPGALLALAIGLSLFFLGRRVRAIVCFERDRARRRATDRSITTIPCDFRAIDVYASRAYTGTPFTGGVLRPYICIPESACARLSPTELRAVIDHEVGHVHQFDLVGTFMIEAIGDWFWFVPGYRHLGRRIDRLREILADEFAVRAGTDAVVLASALLSLRTPTIVSASVAGPVLYSAFFRTPSVLRERVERLVGQGAATDASRFGWAYWPVRSAIFAVTVGAVSLSSMGENHEIWGAGLKTERSETAGSR